MENKSKYNNITVVFTISSIVFFVFAIKAIIETQWNDVTDLCEDSNLWYYLTSILVFNILNRNLNDDKEKNKEVFIIVISLIGLFIWGAYELFGVKCINNLNTTLLYKLSLAYWIFVVVILGILILTIFCIGYLFSVDTSTTTNNVPISSLFVFDKNKTPNDDTNEKTNNDTNEKTSNDTNEKTSNLNV
jgi:hypothetical protein